MLAERDPRVNEILLQASHIIPDGTGILWASRREEEELKNRITGISLFEEICLNAVEIGAKLFLFGASPAVVEATRKTLLQKYPAIVICGIMDGYTEEEEALVQQIDASGANLLAVAMGSPKQELWIAAHAEQFHNINVFIGLGGAFDVISGKIKRSPKWMLKLGLEWLYRICRQPILRFRNIFTLIQFCKVVFTQKK